MALDVLERTILFFSGDTIDVGDLPAELRTAEAIRTRTPTGELAAAAMATAASIAAEGGTGSLKEMVRAETSRVERELIARALDETGGNVTQAAKLLKISRKSLQMKMKEFGLRDREAGP